MDGASVEAAFAMGEVAGRFAWADETLTFTPVTPLRPQATYTVEIGAACRDRHGAAGEAVRRDGF